MRFEFTLGSSGVHRRSDDEPQRLLVLSDLRGTGAGPAEPLPARRLLKADVDSLDDVLARVAPVIQLGAAAGGERIEVRRFEDLHPDTLVETLSVFQRLRDVRSRLEHPQTFEAAVADLRGDAAGQGSTPPAAGGAAPPVGSDAETLDRLLGRTSAQMPTAAPVTVPHAPANTVDALIRHVVAPHIVPAPSPQLPQMLAAVDAAMTDLMRAVLHDAAFQQVEATWRGIQWLVSMLDLGESLELHLLHVTRDELTRESTPDGGLWRRLVERESSDREAPRLAALIVDASFGPSADDVAALERLGTLAARLGAPLIAGASSSIIGATALASQADPREWTRDAEDEARWDAFRAHPAAAHVGLALPRVLLRLPYGRRTDPIAAFAFEEQSARPEHAAFLWGTPAFAYAVVVARTLNPDVDVSAACAIEGLPAYVFSVDDERVLQSAAEVVLTERAVEAIQARGLMPVIAFRNRDDVRLVPPSPVASAGD